MIESNKKVTPKADCINAEKKAEPSVKKDSSKAVYIEWDKKEDATKFTESEDLKKTMQEAGVLGKPDIWFLDKIEDFKL